ncbi:hypothetical protein [Fibrella aquatilis]|uniref:Uncharacterized protein n=1 Tax=Fibrella aquatilis TaxID=2817059 RepID=A0A939G113_9BACT|nr:hypothetical protein [Fibrella aquatilis]MBO0930447.1 hypothetical protein [Fibrella aquatilis]
MKSRVIFASLILGLVLTTTANAATTITDDSPAATKSAGALLINGSEKQFAHFIEQRANRFSRTSAWQTYMNVVSMYNQNPIDVLRLSAADRAEFVKASSEVSGQLARQKQAEAVQWAGQVNNTVRTISYFWTVSQDQAQLPENE